MQKTHKNLLIGATMGMLASIIWGSWPVISKVASYQSLSPMDLTFLRFAVAGVILFPVLVLQSVTLRQIFTQGCVLAFCAGAPYVLLATTGINQSSSAHFGIIAPSSMLIFSTLGSVLFFSEKFNKSITLGTLLILAGVLVVSGKSLLTLNTSTLLGDLMCLGCGLLWASFTLLCKYWQINAWKATAMVSVVSAAFYIPFYITFANAELLEQSLDILIFQGFYQGIIVAIVALYLYTKAVVLLGSAKGAIFAALVPPTSLVLGSLLLNEMLSWVEFVGLVCVCTGMFIALELKKLLPIPFKFLKRGKSYAN